ncbi:MAG: hypothetical protein R3F61_20430 [Myxococcota bacterium]
MSARAWSESLVATVVTLALCEGALRLAGYGPWAPFETFEGLPRMSDPHASLGWVNRPGRHTVELGGRTVTVTVDERGDRATPPSGGPRSVGLYGGSYLFGFGLDDTEVVSTHLAAARPDLTVRNHAVPGYGTLQSVTALEERVRSSGGCGEDVVVYGLTELHDGRNVAAWSWLHALERSARDQGWTVVPTAQWDGERLVVGEPVTYRHWSASERSAIVNRAEHARNALHDRFLRTKAETTVQLVLRFREIVEVCGGAFRVALLDAPTRSAVYLRRFAEEGVDVIDLRHPHFPEWSIPGDGHPDARVHADWARRLAEVL